MKKFNTIIVKEMQRRGMNKNHLATECKLGGQIVTNIFNDVDITTKSLHKILDFLFPGWEEKFK